MRRSPVAALAAGMLAVVAACNSSDSLAPLGANLKKNDVKVVQAPNVLPPPTVVVSGLHFPRGFAFGPDSAIYVAEAGTIAGNDTATDTLCTQVPAPIGPWRGGFTGRISRVALDGTRTTVVRGLPSARTRLGDVAGVTDIAFIAGQMYALITAGCSHGHYGQPSSVVKVYSGRTARVVNLSTWIKNHPAASTNPADFEPDGNWYSMVASVDRLFAVEANQGNLVRVIPSLGRTSRVADISATEDHAIPSGLANSSTDNSLYVGELTTIPAYGGAASVLQYSRAGAIIGRLAGFTAVTGVETDAAGNVYVLETFPCQGSVPCFPTVRSGTVTKVAPDGTRTPVAMGLSFPTAMHMGPDGALYVTTYSYGYQNVGQIVRISL